MSAKLRVVDDPAGRCAELLTEVAAAGGDIVLAGGSTPRAAYEHAAGAGTSWSRATAWFGDERCVAPDDERSNYAMAKAALFDPLGANAPTVKRILGERGPTEAADDYERELRAAGLPGFDLLLLGLGPDGHTASLFPDQDSLAERSRLVVGVDVPGLEPIVSRVTLTLPALASARQIVFLVTGAEKADAVAAAFGPEATPDPHVPASLLAPLTDAITVLLDAAAASKVASAV
ncbi:MAG TPA: 6-phosphogluconolactonase [Solirubrobacteraceae bacterium]|jgi:6-phosphogluconolactonase|nr:6-phosphogluconolactonase [Solirubrobacteraceae bacterium]